MKPPVIHQIQLLRTDRRILVQAIDNVMVTKVEVMVLDPERAGVVVEQGAGIRGEGDHRRSLGFYKECDESCGVIG